MRLKVRLSGINGCIGKAGSMPQLAVRLLYIVENWEKKHELGLCSFTRLWDSSQGLRKVTAAHLWFSTDMVSSPLAPFQMHAVKKVWGNVRADRMASENPSVSVTAAYYCPWNIPARAHGLLTLCTGDTRANSPGSLHTLKSSMSLVLTSRLHCRENLLIA